MNKPIPPNEESSGVPVCPPSPPSVAASAPAGAEIVIYRQQARQAVSGSLRRLHFALSQLRDAIETLEAAGENIPEEAYPFDTNLVTLINTVRACERDLEKAWQA